MFVIVKSIPIACLSALSTILWMVRNMFGFASRRSDKDNTRLAISKGNIIFVSFFVLVSVLQLQISQSGRPFQLIKSIKGQL